MERISITLQNPQTARQQLGDVWAVIRSALMIGERLVLEVRQERRSDSQNRMLWSILGDVSKQVPWHGQSLSPDDFKDMATATLKKQRVVPGMEGSGFVLLGQRTSKMTKAELSELVEFLYAFGASHGVKWSRTSLGRDVPDEVA